MGIARLGPLVPFALAAACTPIAPPDREPVPEPPATPAKGDAITDVRPAAEGLRLPWDALPSHDGSQVFFTALGAEGAGVWRLDAEGQAPVLLAAGLDVPLGLALSTDGETLYVADVGADGPNDESGVVYTIPAAGGQLAALEATRGMRPKGMTVVERDDADVLVFTGADDGEAGLFELPLAGGAVTAIAKGAPFSDPSGLDVAADGAFYVADTTASISGKGAVIAVEDGAARVLMGEMSLGCPAGVALTADDQVLLVSGLDPNGGGAQVYVVDVETAVAVTTNAGIAGNDEAAGLHRARDANRYAWGGTSTVYVLDAQPNQ